MVYMKIKTFFMLLSNFSQLKLKITKESCKMPKVAKMYAT
jgi:hypothetical protein